MEKEKAPSTKSPPSPLTESVDKKKDAPPQPFLLPFQMAAYSSDPLGSGNDESFRPSLSLSLQRLAGNAATGRLLTDAFVQPALQTGSPAVPLQAEASPLAAGVGHPAEKDSAQIIHPAVKLQRAVGNRAIERFLGSHGHESEAGQARSTPVIPVASPLAAGQAVQRKVSPDYDKMVAKLSYGAFDWAVSDEDANQVLLWLQPLSAKDLSDTIKKLDDEGYLDRLLDNISSKGRTTYKGLIGKIYQARKLAKTEARLQDLLSYGLFDWVVTDADAHEVLVNLQALSGKDFSDAVKELDTKGYLDRLLDNISEKDQVSYKSLIQKIYQSRSAAQTSARLESFLSYGLFDWVVTDEDAHEVLVNLQALPGKDFSDTVQLLDSHGYLDRLLDNIGEVDSKTYSSLINRIYQERSAAKTGERLQGFLSYGLFDWAVTDQDSHEVLKNLQLLSADKFVKTVLQLDANGYLDRLLENISESDRTNYQALIEKIRNARSIDKITGQIQNLLSYGILDWEITEAEAHEVLINLNDLPDERLRVLVFRLEQNGYFQRLLDNVSSADQAQFAVLLIKLGMFRSEFRDLMVGTSIADPALKREVEALLTPGIVRDPVTGVRAPFVDIVGGRSYRQDIEAKLDQARAWMFPQSQSFLTRSKLPMDRFEGVGAEAKRQTDAVFGHYTSGKAFEAGRNLIDRSLQTPDAADLVDYLIHNQEEVLPVHSTHSAVPGDATEKAIIDAIIRDYSAAHRTQLDVIDRAWPAVAGGGVVQIQPFAASTPAATRKMFWDTFQTMIHEYLHIITHPFYESVARGLGKAQASILIEGGTSLFTDEVWKTIHPNEIRANDALRANVEGAPYPYDASVIPAISHYRQITQAQDIQSEVGPENMKAAYFLGHIELLGLGPAWAPAAAARAQTFVVPAAGIQTVADVAAATGVSASDIAAANSMAADAAVTAGQSLSVPGIRIHYVVGGEDKKEIARQHGVTEQQLEKANPAVLWGVLLPGEEIVIPAH